MGMTNAKWRAVQADMARMLEDERKKVRELEVILAKPALKRIRQKVEKLQKDYDAAIQLLEREREKVRNAEVDAHIYCRQVDELKDVIIHYAKKEARGR